MPSVLLCSPCLPLSKMGSLPTLQGSPPVQPVSPSTRGCALVCPGQGEPWVLGVPGTALLCNWPIHRLHPSLGPSVPGPFLGSPSLSLWLR
uniref:Uncharacterized protein n=1 Tax=Gorilla gorilla gorilla TaxID=9595 RepID=A0A2I2YNP2_GORGO